MQLELLNLKRSRWSSEIDIQFYFSLTFKDITLQSIEQDKLANGIINLHISKQSTFLKQITCINIIVSFIRCNCLALIN